VADLKKKGDLAELKVASDLLARGHRIAIPFGEDSDYDLICDTGEALHRIQVKFTKSDGCVLAVRCGSHSLTNGKVRRRKLYTAATLDWIAVYDRTSDRCYYVSAGELGAGRTIIHLRLKEARNGQRQGIHFANDYESFPLQKLGRLEMEPAGLEPATFRMQTERSSN
jgi:hypothetical protein